MPALHIQDEVRALGRLPELNVPEAFITRHPFPGETLDARAIVPSEASFILSFSGRYYLPACQLYVVRTCICFLRIES